METLIKIGLDKRINGEEPSIIELGCGRKDKQGRITVDKEELPNVPVSWNRGGVYAGRLVTIFFI